MTYSYHSHYIYNDETKSGIGHVTRHGNIWVVKDGDFRGVAVVNRLSEAGPVLAAHYDRHATWVREGENYVKLTKFGALEVFPFEGGWAAWRNGERHLMRHDEIAIFSTSEEAQKAAGAHAGDGVPASNQTTDGPSWQLFDFDVAPASRDCPEVAQVRA